MAIAMPLARLRRPGPLLLGLGLELEGRGIEAVPQAGRRRAVGEDVPEMTAATPACDLRPHHAVAAVLVLLDPSLGARPGNARPAGARYELGVRDEQLLA